jgi:hypothetical protein
VPANEKLTAFVELESGIPGCCELACRAGGIFAKFHVAKRDLNQAEENSPAGFLASFRPSNAELTQ